MAKLLRYALAGSRRRVLLAWTQGYAAYEPQFLYRLIQRECRLLNGETAGFEHFRVPGSFAFEHLREFFGSTANRSAAFLCRELSQSGFSGRYRKRPDLARSDMRCGSQRGRKFESTSPPISAIAAGPTSS
jgi:hypothetical protein